MSVRRLACATALACALAACAADSATSPDSGTGGDASVVCTLRLEAPPMPVAPATLVITAVVEGGTGLIDVAWAVTGPDGLTAPSTPRGPGDAELELFAEYAGVYLVSASATRGDDSCRSGFDELLVTEQGARTASYTLSYTPLAGQPAPTQRDPSPVVVYGGTDRPVGNRALDPGAPLAGVVRGPTGGIAAYLKLARQGDGAEVELFAAADGSFATLLPSGEWSLLVVPDDPVVPPARLSELTELVMLDAGEQLSGVVIRADGTPVAGARVAAHLLGLPASFTTTAADGTFELFTRSAGAPLGLAVVPPAGEGLPGLELSADSGIVVAPDGFVEIRLADAAPVLLMPELVSSSGEPVPGARVTFVATSLSVAGEVTVTGAASVLASGASRVVAVAGPDGRLPAVPLHLGTWEAVVEAPALGVGEALALIAIDLTTGEPAGGVMLTTAATEPRELTVTDDTGAPVSGADVVASSRGLHGVGAGVASRASSDVNGVAHLSLAPGLDYDVVVEPPRAARLARARAALGNGASVISLTRAVYLRGTVVFSGGTGVGGVRVAAWCDGCDAPVAETITHPGGAFMLRVPDPGVAP